MIEIDGLTKRYGDKTAVEDLSFTAPDGTVTGFLGPNGAGKSTTMRMIAGLDEPTSGHVLVNGRQYRRSDTPMDELGILLEAKSVHTGRSARNHLLALAQIAAESIYADEALQVTVLKNNLDPLHPDSVSYGTHESYTCWIDLDAAAEPLVPHLVSRLIFAGAGALSAQPPLRVAPKPGPPRQAAVIERWAQMPPEQRSRALAKLPPEPWTAPSCW